MEGLQSRPDYPKEKPWYFKPEKDLRTVDYNIITNYDLTEHHFAAPEKRPECAEWKVSIFLMHLICVFLQVKFPPNMNKNFKDYNIVSNKYLEFND